jgi:glycosyltransferase involved in cell wall biosynthesis
MAPNTDDLASSIHADSSPMSTKLQGQAIPPLHRQSASSAVGRRDAAPLTMVPGGRDDAWLQSFPLIVHSHLRWDFVWQRPQQILSRLARHHPVLFIEEPIPAEGEPGLDLSEPQANIVRAVPRLQASDMADADSQARAVLPLVQRALLDHPLLAGRFARPVQWFYSPMTAPVLLGGFGACGVVYDCMDELANFRFAPTDISAREQFLLSRADVVFTGGYQLFEAKSRAHGNVHFFGCGVDVEHFGRARGDGLDISPALEGLPRPLLGYFGVIDERLDYALIGALADAFPAATVVMAGPLAKVEREQLPAQANIRWLGQRAYEELPSLVKGFDVCLMPFALNDATRYINPTKTLEYLAAGKPVVSTAVADVVRNFGEVVEVAGDAEGFIQAVRRSLETADPQRVADGVARAEAATWDATVAAMRGHVQSGVRLAGAERDGAGECR